MNDGYSIASFELSELKGKTKVILTHESVKSFSGDDSNMERDSFVVGWNDIIKSLLKDYVGKIPERIDYLIQKLS
ncbi:hypothetical protein CLV62_14216 [Dysgonomonas alginatilytica]|uniref:Activator of Hsp90 ATPase-like protein n=1 Tax=Dysgonomonas alginatilytica TaxID=1605892 RepID=A0A2V3PHW7_9BACT|nr:hypothetical protein [Dysgonomonas alginatilytica]PXV58869.1 hypothetical protein CLV62_14216 [Dysgonomonas alginatilytica]